MRADPERAETSPRFVERLEAHLRQRTAAARGGGKRHTDADRQRLAALVEQDRSRPPAHVVSAMQDGQIEPGDVEVVLTTLAAIRAVAPAQK